MGETNEPRCQEAATRKPRGTGAGVPESRNSVRSQWIAGSFPNDSGHWRIAPERRVFLPGVTLSTLRRGAK